MKKFYIIVLLYYYCITYKDEIIIVFAIKNCNYCFGTHF